MRKPDYYESQKFTQWWLWAIILSSTLLVGGLLFADFARQLNNLTSGDRTTTPLWFIAFCILIMFGLIWLFIKLTLEIKIDRTGVHYRFFPIIPSWKTISKSEIQHWEVQKYLVLGYGIRLSWGMTTLNVGGNMALTLHYAGNKKLRLGTQKPDELTQAMKALFYIDPEL